MENNGEVDEVMINAAIEYLKQGYRPIPLLQGTKRAAIRWKPFQARAPTAQEVRGWFASGEPNIALVTGDGVVVVDIDDPAFLDQVLEHCGNTPMRCRTPSGGIHLWYGMRKGIRYGNAVRIRNRPIDLRCEGAYACVPWSRNSDGASYRWLGDILPVSQLPPLKVRWLRVWKRRPLKVIPLSGNADAIVRRARGYVAHIEGAISGCGGHNRTMRVAGVLIQKFGLSIEQAMPVFQEWNHLCEPLWSEKELLHKLQDAKRLLKQSQKGGDTP